ncbi:transposon protein, putative, CACTA, En/Spm sub-class [Hordeum vulgare]|nr:transposon protein, putative, CACTA, En/Spm sub-class [Hordeum vulgare]
MTIHLCNNGFMLGYERWTSHGESVVPENVEHDNVGDGDRMNDMLVDAIVAEGVSKDADQFVDESAESRKEADDVELDPPEIEIIENQNNNVEGEDSAEDELEDSTDEEEENLSEEEGQEETYETEDEDDAIEHDSEYDDDDY